MSLRKHGPHQGGIERFNGADTAVNTPAGKPKILQVARLPPSGMYLSLSFLPAFMLSPPFPWLLPPYLYLHSSHNPDDGGGRRD